MVGVLHGIREWRERDTFHFPKGCPVGVKLREQNRCPSSLYPHTLLPWIFLINFLPMKIGRMLPLFSLLQTLLLPAQMIFTSVCGAQRKKRTPPLTMVSLFVTNMRIAPILSTVPPLPLRTITLRSSTVQSGNAQRSGNIVRHQAPLHSEPQERIRFQCGRERG